jgi:hypothetical protein
MHTNKFDAETDQPVDWKLKEQEQWQSEAGLDYETISAIAKNFQALADIIRESHYPFTRSSQPQEFVQRLRDRPNEAYSTQLSQKQIKRLAQIPPSEV